VTDDATDFIAREWRKGIPLQHIADALGLSVYQVRASLPPREAAVRHFEAWRDLRQRLAWNYGDASERMEKMQSDIAKWRGLGR
jgi:hypothetical protein